MSDEMFYFHIHDRMLHKVGCAHIASDAGQSDDWIGPHVLKRIVVSTQFLGETSGFSACQCVPMQTWQELITD